MCVCCVCVCVHLPFDTRSNHNTQRSADDQLTSQSEGGCHIDCRSEGGHFGSISQMQQSNKEDTTNIITTTTHVTTTTTRVDKNVHPNPTECKKQPRPTPKASRQQDNAEETQRRDHNYTMAHTRTFSESPRRSIQRNRRQPKQHGETQQQKSRRGRNHDGPDTRALADKR